MIHLEIFETPVSWSAPQTKGRIHYNPKNKEKQATIRKIQQLYKGPILDEYVVLDFTFRFRPPESASKGKRDLMIHGITIPTKKDVTNLIKFYEDCLKKIVITDDRLVEEIYAKKMYAEKESIDIKIFTLRELKGEIT